MPPGQSTIAMKMISEREVVPEFRQAVCPAPLDMQGMPVADVSAVSPSQAFGVIALSVLAGASGPSARPAVQGAGAPSNQPAAIQWHVGHVAAQVEALLHANPTLAPLYERNQYAPLWFDSSGRLNSDARDARALLEHADEEGLDPRAYIATELAGLAAPFDCPPSAREAAALDVALSAAMLSYLRHLHMGRVDPRAIGFRLRAPDHLDDFAEILYAARAAHRLKEAAAGLRPPLAQYGLLRSMLARYRVLAAHTPPDALPPIKTSVKPGDAYDMLAPLVRRLVALGDLPADAHILEGGTVYDGVVVEGVRRFQARHGLESDGILGRQTLAALQVPLQWRVRQIELALERLRWLPDLSGGPTVTVNIPSFELRIWDSIGPTSTPQPGMGVIVGRALSTQTPVFAAEMRSVIFRPYWNVPRSIIVNETLPAIRRNPAYLDRNDMEIVAGSTAVPTTPENLEQVRRGRYGVRQRPGPTNALGLIKFDLPNAHDVYMHDTPATALFSRSRRDFSHGCVRVEDPVRLAEWVLAGDGSWPRERIIEAMNGSRTFPVSLPRPVLVLMFYVTALVRPEDGAMTFAEDIYRHDVQLDRALSTSN